MTTEEKFNAAVNVIKNLPKDGPYQPSNEILLRFYSYYKQATEGPCDQPKPAFWEVVKKVKWDAWRKLGDMPKEEAMNCYIEELKKVILQIVETMSFTDKVADFMDNVGPFYEMVELPLPKKKDSYNEEDQENSYNGDNPITIFITSEKVDNCKYLGCTLRAGRPRNETATNTFVNGIQHGALSQKPDWESVEEDTIQANGNVPMKSSHSENCFGSTDSEDDEFSDPVETEDFSGNKITGSYLLQCNGDVADSGYNENINGSENGDTMEHKEEHNVTNASYTPLKSQTGSDSHKSMSNGPSDGIASRGGGDPMATRPNTTYFGGLGPQQFPSSGNPGVPFGTSSTGGRSFLMGSGGGRGGNPGGYRKVGDVNEQIAQALAHLQQDMESVLARLNTLEALTVAHHNIAQGQIAAQRNNSVSPEFSKFAGYSWWPFKNMSFKTVAFFLAWPVVLHIVLTLLSARRARRHRR